MSLVEHAERELTRTGWLDGDDAQSGQAMLGAVREFATGGWSGGSAPFAIRIVGDLLQFKPLGPLTDDPAEWIYHTDSDVEGKPLWQSSRDSSCFSNDGGKTYYDIDECPTRYDWDWRFLWLRKRRFEGHVVGFTSVGRDRDKLKRHRTEPAR